MKVLTREDILGVNDIEVKDIEVKGWGGKVFIRQLSRGQQDEYLKRQYGSARLKQELANRGSEVSSVSIFGHDAFLCACGLCDETGKPLFSEADISKLKDKNGAIIGHIAVEIVKFSEMTEDVETASRIEEDLKN